MLQQISSPITESSTVIIVYGFKMMERAMSIECNIIIPNQRMFVTHWAPLVNICQIKERVKIVRWTIGFASKAILDIGILMVDHCT